MALTLNDRIVDPSILGTHPVLSTHTKYHLSLADLILREAEPNNAFEKSWIDDIDKGAAAKLSADNVKCVDGDAMLQVINSKGKKIDAFVGVIVSASQKRILAVECKLKVNGGKQVDLIRELCEEIIEKFISAKHWTTEHPIAFDKICVVLFGGLVFEKARTNLRNIQKEHSLSKKYDHLLFLSVAGFEGSLRR